MVDELLEKMPELDYLQVFDIEVNGDTVTIHHKQEQPPYRKTHYFKTDDLKDGQKYKVYVIDDLTHTTMLLASEY
jgi:hypothetical protein